MKKKLLLMIVCGCLIAGVFSVLTPAVRAYATGDNYPYWDQCAGCHATWKGDSHSDVSVYGFYYRQCTDFAAYCLNARNEVYFVNSGSHAGITWGDAKNWGSAARRAGYAVDGNPAVGAVAWWGSGTYGHVAWVREVNGGTVTIEEYNYGSPVWHEDTLPYRKDGRDDPPDGYIHFPLKGAPPPAAPVQNLGSDFYACISFTKSGLFLENRDGNVQTASPNGYDPRQIWHFCLQNYGQYCIVNMYDGRCIDAANFGTANGTNVQVVVDSNNAAQRWLLCGESAGNRYYVHPAYLSDQRLVWDVEQGSTSPGTNVRLWENWYQTNGGTFDEGKMAGETFSVHKIDFIDTRLAYDMGADFYARISYNGSHLETTGVITQDGQNMDVVTCKTLKPNDEKQIWHFIRQDNGSYKIVNEYAGWCLDVADGIAEDGVRVRTWSLDNGSAAQRWYLMKSPGDSTCRIASALGFPNSIYSLDVPVSAPDAAASDGMRPTVFKQHQNANQQFTITRVDPPSPPDPEILPDAITNVEADPAGKTVLAALQNRTEAVLTGAVYSRTGRLLSAAMTPVSANCGLAALRFQTLPAGCTIKLALLDSGTWRPLCAAYQISP